MGRWRHGRSLVLLAAAVAVAGCEEEPAETAERVRAIKPYYVVEPAGGNVRRYAGTIEAANSSALSFAVSGTVETVVVNQGDRVRRGDVLATLDVEPFALNLDAARSELAAAQAEFDNARVQLDRQRQLFERGWVAKAALDQAVAAFDAAEGQLNLSRSRLGLAERDKANTRLLAPFDGVIAQRDIEPFVEVSKGQTLFQLDSNDVFEVALSIPDAIVGRLTIGAPVSIDAAPIAGCGCAGRITEIGAEAGAANAVPVRATILEGPDGLLPGMAVEAGVTLTSDAGAEGFMLPLVAIAPGDEQAQGYVFKYDAVAGVVRRTPVKGEDVVRGNLVGVSEGVTAGDIVAAAGVSLLRDGQRVKLMGQ